MKKDLFSKNIIFMGVAFILAFLIAWIIYFFDKSNEHPKVRTVLRWGIVILILLSAVFLFIIIRG